MLLFLYSMILPELWCEERKDHSDIKVKRRNKQTKEETKQKRNKLKAIITKCLENNENERIKIYRSRWNANKAVLKGQCVAFEK